MSLSDHLSRPSLPEGSSDLPESTTGRLIALFRSCFEWGLHVPSVTSKAVVSYTAFPPLPQKWRYISVALVLGVFFFFFFFFFLVASTGRYPASCPVKPGLSSPAEPFRRNVNGWKIHKFLFPNQIQEVYLYTSRRSIHIVCILQQNCCDPGT